MTIKRISTAGHFDTPSLCCGYSMTFERISTPGHFDTPSLHCGYSMTFERISTPGHFDTPSLHCGYSMPGLRIFAMPMIPVTAARPLELPGICHPAVEAKKKCCKKYKDGKRCKDCPKR